MFTPIGEGGRLRGRRRRGRRVVAVLLLCALVAGAGAAAYWWYFVGDRDDGQAAARPATTPATACTTPTPTLPASLPAASEVKVEVLNATDRNGLATRTADSLAARGFDVVAWGNAEHASESVAVVTYGKGDLPGAVVVASYVPGAELQPVTRNTGGVIVLTVGEAFDAIATHTEAQDNLDSVALPTPSPVCSPVGA